MGCANTRVKSADLIQKMASTLGRVRSSLFSDGDCFDMWHDYMNLSTLLERLGEGRGTERTNPGTERSAAAGGGGEAEGGGEGEEVPWGHIQTLQNEDNSNHNSAETSSVSSLSDTSSSGTSSDLCRFCRQNGETARVYRSHKLKSDDGKVICPILFNYTCPICAATGHYAHTRRYCPQAKRQRGKTSGSKFW